MVSSRPITILDMMRAVFASLLFIIPFSPVLAQWRMQESHTTANLRGIHAVDASIAWASGSDGTVLRTVDGGVHWQACAVPPGAEKLDFRAVWAWDANRALVMSAGTGELSRTYRTADGCRHWTAELRNTKKDGFWDAIAFQLHSGVLLGDPVNGHFDTWLLNSDGNWSEDQAPCAAQPGEAAFAASNSSLVVFDLGRYMIGTGGKAGPRVLISPLLAGKDASKGCLAVPVPLASGNESSGIFSLAFRDRDHGVAVGGDYKKPNLSSGTAAFTSDGGHHWTATSQPPHGYRSAVAWDADRKAWIAAGTNGSDISRDDGKTWQLLDDGNWNALSLPFIVGPKGVIAKRQ